MMIFAYQDQHGDLNWGVTCVPTSVAFRDQMVATVQGFSGTKSNGHFINSCFIHGQSENRATWNENGSPTILNKVPSNQMGLKWIIYIKHGLM